MTLENGGWTLPGITYSRVKATLFLYFYEGGRRYVRVVKTKDDIKSIWWMYDKLP